MFFPFYLMHHSFSFLVYDTVIKYKVTMCSTVTSKSLGKGCDSSLMAAGKAAAVSSLFHASEIFWHHYILNCYEAL